MEYLFRTGRSVRVAELIESEEVDLHVPALCDVEVVAAVRRIVLAGIATPERGRQALDDYLDLPLTRHGHLRLLPRILTLWANFSAYDATYVILAQSLGASLLTTDEALQRAVLAHTTVAALQ